MPNSKGNDMNIPNRLNALTGPDMDPMRKASLWTGIFFVITYITSIPALLIFNSVLDDPNYIVGAGSDNRLLLGVFLELILIIANIATAVVLFPVIKRQSEVLSLGFVTARVVESVFIAVGILSVLAVVTLRQDVAGTAGVDSGSLVIAGQSLVAVKDASFLLGPGFVVGVGNGMILGYLMYRSRLVPRPMAILGLIGGPLICVSGIAMVFGVLELGSPLQMLASAPEFLWELALGIWLIVKGFNASPITSASPETASYELQGAD
jgi:hypothetical protein